MDLAQFNLQQSAKDSLHPNLREGDRLYKSTHDSWELVSELDFNIVIIPKGESKSDSLNVIPYAIIKQHMINTSNHFRFLYGFNVEQFTEYFKEYNNLHNFLTKIDFARRNNICIINNNSPESVSFEDTVNNITYKIISRYREFVVLFLTEDSKPSSNEMSLTKFEKYRKTLELRRVHKDLHIYQREVDILSQKIKDIQNDIKNIE